MHTHATKVDKLFDQLTALLKEILMDAGERGLDLEEAAELSAIHECIIALWDSYLDRMIELAASKHPNPRAAVAMAGEDVEELDAARERVQAKPTEQGVPLDQPKKVTYH